MSSELPPLNQMLDEVISAMYNNGEEIRINIKNFYVQKGWSFRNQRAEVRFERILLMTDWVTMNGANDIWLKTNALDLMDRYGIYSKWEEVHEEFQMKQIQDKRKKERKEQRKATFEYIIKHAGTIVAIILSLTTAIVSIMTLSDKRELQSIELELRDVRKGQDTLIQWLTLPQKISDTLSKE